MTYQGRKKMPRAKALQSLPSPAAEPAQTDAAKVLGDVTGWVEQARQDYAALFVAVPLLDRTTEALAAVGDSCGTDALAEIGAGLAAMSTRFAGLAKLAEAGAGVIAATLARRPDGDQAAMAIAAELTASDTDAGADAALIQACADVFRLDQESRDFYVLAEAHDKTDPAAAKQYHGEGEKLGSQYWDLIRQIARTPASGPAGLRAKAKLLFDWVDTEAGGAFPENGYPDQILGYSLAVDLMGRH